MKNLFFLFLLILLPSVLAMPTLTFQHQNITQGETIFATITTTGQFEKQIEPEDITFLEGRKKVFFESGITFYNDTHYLYIYTTRPGNFTIKISNVLYKETDELKSKTIEKQFTISTPTNESQILSIKPGFLITTTNAQIKLINKAMSNLNITYEDQTISLSPLNFQKITFQPTKTFSLLKLQTYKTFQIPIIYPTANNSQFKPPTIQLDLKQDPEMIYTELIVKNSTQKTIKLFNFGNENITNIQAESNLSFIQIQAPTSIEPRQIQNLTIEISPETPGQFEDQIKISYFQYNETNILEIPLTFLILPNGSNQNDFNVTEDKCTDKNGTLCTNEEICDSKAFFTSDGYCCPGTCEPIEPKDDNEGASFKWLIGILILIVLAAIGFYLYKRQKKTKPHDASEQLKESTEKFTKRMQGAPSIRTKGSLSKS